MTRALKSLSIKFFDLFCFGFLFYFHDLGAHHPNLQQHLIFHKRRYNLEMSGKNRMC